MKLYRLLCLLCWLCIYAAHSRALDREAFAISNYDLEVRIEPAQQRLGARGKITLRNDTTTPQKTAVLQISSSLNWLAIKSAGQGLQFAAEPYNSDIDHTGVLSEAIVTLPSMIPPKKTIDLEVAYEGIIPLDATRLTRMDTPQAAARSTDWDQISPQFTAVRGVGYVAWYPIITDQASMAQGTDLFEVLNRWKARVAASTMHFKFSVWPGDANERPEVLVNASACPIAREVEDRFVADCTYRSPALVVPTFVIANYEVTERPNIEVHFLRGHDELAANYADAAQKVVPLITAWFGRPARRAIAADLKDPDAAPFESASLLLTPLAGIDSTTASLIAAHQLTHAAFTSPRPWINEGLAHLVQALYLEQQSGRQAALDYMATHRFALNAAADSKQAAPRLEDEVSGSLINTPDEEFLRSKAMYVWWMLRDMIGDPALKKALASYRTDQDKDPSYMQRLIQAQTERDLEWFFDDWVYRERGLPDFKIESVFTRKLLPEGYLVTVTVSNSGEAGAEVPLLVKCAGEDVTKRLTVPGKGSSSIRIETVNAPEEIVVNDGSVPESDVSNHVYRIDANEAGK
jgi:hypothetical protein